MRKLVSVKRHVCCSDKPNHITRKHNAVVFCLSVFTCLLVCLIVPACPFLCPYSACLHLSLSPSSRLFARCCFCFIHNRSSIHAHAVSPFSISFITCFCSILSVWLTGCTSLSICQPFCLLALFLPAHLPALSASRVMFTREVNEVSTTNATFKYLAPGVFSPVRRAELEMEWEGEH